MATPEKADDKDKNAAKPTERRVPEEWICKAGKEYEPCATRGTHRCKRWTYGYEGRAFDLWKCEDCCKVMGGDGPRVGRDY